MNSKAAIVREKGGLFQVEDVEIREPRENEVLVRIAGCGLCHTDLAAKDQLMPSPLPIVLGHEGSGIVKRVGDRVRKVKPGDHVVLTFLSCETCSSCKKGMPNLCTSAFPLNLFGTGSDESYTMKRNGEAIFGSFFGPSSFATYALSHEVNTVVVPEDIPIEILGPLGCGVQAGAGGVINSLHPKAGSSIAIFGAGSVGISAILAALICGCTKIITIDINEERLKKALELGATHAINSSGADAVAGVQDIAAGGVDYSLECTGVPKVIRQAVDVLAVGGTCGLIGAPPQGTEMHLDVASMLLGRSVRGILGGDSVPDIFIPQLIELYRQGRFPFDKMITFYGLGQINEAVEDSGSGKTLKPVIRP
jgi:aryl-alcohol dehydrogenase